MELNEAHKVFELDNVKHSLDVIVFKVLLKIQDHVQTLWTITNTAISRIIHIVEVAYLVTSDVESNGDYYSNTS